MNLKAHPGKLLQILFFFLLFLLMVGTLQTVLKMSSGSIEGVLTALIQPAFGNCEVEHVQRPRKFILPAYGLAGACF